ncbi:MAG: prepilin peptidase [Patescibacteria group bacterium]|nr:prepilin peptidase [Patescibacteria group bacterium]
MVNLFIYIFIFLFGLCIGSFLNCIIYRLSIEMAEDSPRPLSTGGEGNRGFVAGHSYCPHCQHILKPKDLIPVLSYMFLKGKCRYCGKSISIQYPLIELATGLLFVFLFWHLSFGLDLERFGIIWILNFIFYLIIACFLIIIFVYDFKHYIIPDKVIYPAIIISFIYFFINNWNFMFSAQIISKFSNFIFPAILASGFFLLIVLASRGLWMGMGDVKFAFLMGLILGYPNILLGLFLSFSFGAIIGMILILRRKKTLKSEMPFAPFLVLGTFFAFFWGDKIMNWYLNLI